MWSERVWSERVWNEKVWRGCGRRGCGGRGVEGGGMEGGGVEEERWERWYMHKSTNPFCTHTHHPTHTHTHTYTHKHTHIHTTDRSTVEFAREVAETKAMDDALNRLDEMIGSSSSHDTFTSPRMGSSPPQGRDHSISSSVLHLAR